MSKYIEPNETGLFDKAERLEELHAMGDRLARLDEVVDWTLSSRSSNGFQRPSPRGWAEGPPSVR